MLKTKVYIPNNNMMLIYKQWAVKMNDICQGFFWIKKCILDKIKLITP